MSLDIHRHRLQGSTGSYKITSYVELTTAATRGYPDWSVVCCVETVGQSKTRQQVSSTFFLNHSAAGQRAANKTTHVYIYPTNGRFGLATIADSSTAEC